ncbi:ribonuclease HI [Candidatus Saccharibacteria bacterium]|nr:ribonuclease HI [Candidatus Saccharibacteria bacterium]
MKILWTDGSASPNPGPGGFAVIEDGKPVVLGKEKESSNIRMEGLAMIAAIEYAGDEGCEIHSDSEFWINVLTKWAKGWKEKGWKKSKGEIANLDIVQRLYELYCDNDVRLVWTRGHVGVKMNELADEWANRARKGETL